MVSSFSVATVIEKRSLTVGISKKRAREVDDNALFFPTKKRVAAAATPKVYSFSVAPATNKPSQTIKRKKKPPMVEFKKQSTQILEIKKQPPPIENKKQRPTVQSKKQLITTIEFKKHSVPTVEFKKQQSQVEKYKKQAPMVEFKKLPVTKKHPPIKNDNACNLQSKKRFFAKPTVIFSVSPTTTEENPSTVEPAIRTEDGGGVQEATQPIAPLSIRDALVKAKRKMFIREEREKEKAFILAMEKEVDVEDKHQTMEALKNLCGGYTVVMGSFDLEMCALRLKLKKDDDVYDVMSESEAIKRKRKAARESLIMMENNALDIEDDKFKTMEELKQLCGGFEVVMGSFDTQLRRLGITRRIW